VDNHIPGNSQKDHHSAQTGLVSVIFEIWRCISDVRRWSAKWMLANRYLSKSTRNTQASKIAFIEEKSNRDAAKN
jgi:hypothetical protein